MYDAVFVRMGKAVANANHELDHIVLSKSMAVCVVKERLTGDMLHDDEKHAIDLAEVVHADEVRVIEARHRFGLGLKTGAKVGISAELLRQDFDGDRAIE